MPEVLEVHGVTGDRDLLCRVVARDNTHLQDVINAMLHTGAVQRSTSAISMTRQIPYRIEPLIAAARHDAVARRGYGYLLMADDRLTPPFVRGHDHALGDAGPVLVLFGDYEDPDTAAAHRGIMELRERWDGFTYAWRHLPIGERTRTPTAPRCSPRAPPPRTRSGPITTSCSRVRMRCPCPTS